MWQVGQCLFGDEMNENGMLRKIGCVHIDFFTDLSKVAWNAAKTAISKQLK